MCLGRPSFVVVVFLVRLLPGDVFQIPLFFLFLSFLLFLSFCILDPLSYIFRSFLALFPFVSSAFVVSLSLCIPKALVAFRLVSFLCISTRYIFCCFWSCFFVFVSCLFLCVFGCVSIRSFIALAAGRRPPHTQAQSAQHTRTGTTGKPSSPMRHDSGTTRYRGTIQYGMVRCGTARYMR